MTPRNLTIAYCIATSLVGTAVILAVAGGIAECLVAHRLKHDGSTWDLFWNGIVRGREWEG